MSIPHALLALLSNEPMFGLRLKEEFETRTGSVWPLNVGQVYTTLQRLERDGHISNDGANADSPGTKRYALTERGRGELARWMVTPPGATPPPRNEVVIKVMVALTVKGLDVGEVIQSHRRQVLEAMQTFTRLKADATDDLALALVVDAELFRLEATARWLDACQARLQRGDRLQLPVAQQPGVAAEPVAPVEPVAAERGGA